MSDEEQSQNDTEISLLTNIKNTLAKQNRTNILQRIVICGLIDGKKDNQVSSFFAKFVKVPAQNDGSELITGLLLLRNGAWIHLFEGSPHQLQTVMTEISQSPSIFDFENVKILHLNEQIDARAFLTWVNKPVDTRNAKEIMDDRNFEENKICETISVIVHALLDIGANLMQVGAAELKSALSTISENYKDLIPSAEMIVELSSSSYVLNIKEYVEFFHCTPYAHLDSEYIWPAQKTILYT